MERFFSDLKTVQRLRSGPLGGYVQKLADQLADSGFRRRFECSFALQTTSADGYAVKSVFRRRHSQMSTSICVGTDL